jgi:hypothetical protein
MGTSDSMPDALLYPTFTTLQGLQQITAAKVKPYSA